MSTRFIGLLITLSLSLGPAQQATACTLFKITQDGRTLVGNHEDAWSINARIRFVNGKNGAYGAVYFAHFNGSPLRRMGDQGGMNEAGLMFDGFVVPVTELRPQPGKPMADIHALVSQAMRTCSTVDQIADLFRPYDLGPLNGGMLFFCDRHGNYLVVEADTLVTGSDATYALGNFRASQCTDLGAVPIERFQRGRRMLAAGPDTSLAYCTTLLDSMSVCRSKLGEGTLYSYLADLNAGIVHVFFYHDFAHRVTFDLKDELAKGDHELEMASLFPTNVEYERLLAYKTPMHQRWLWWSLAGIGVFSLFAGLWAMVLFVMWIVVCVRSRSFSTELPWLPVGVGSALSIFLCAALLVSEGVFYFGLSEAVNRIHPWLKWAPHALVATVLVVGWHSISHSRYRSLLRAWSLVQMGLISGLVYWGLFT